MKKQIKTILKEALEPLFSLEGRVSAYWVSSAHKRLKWVQWRLPPQPEHFEHNIDLYYQWRATRNPMWLERGVYSGLVLKGGNVLELSCGDGFNARNFYSLKSKKVVACDFDPTAIRVANKLHGAPNVEFVLADIRDNMPKGAFDNIVWDSAMEHFTPAEIENIMKNIKARLTPAGIFSGHTIVEVSKDKSLSHHEYEFKNKEDLARFLTPHFKHVTVFETIYPTRHNLHFWASDGPIPFSPDWQGSHTNNK